jgi:hypothetical protein
MTKEKTAEAEEAEEVEAEAKELAHNILAISSGSSHVGALIAALIAVLGSIQCKGCRQKVRESIEDFLPFALDLAMDKPAGEQHHHFH